jgi:hypothetical protein
VLRLAAITYQIAFIIPITIDMTCDDLVISAALSQRWPRAYPHPQKSIRIRAELPLREFCEKLIDTYRSLPTREGGWSGSSWQAILRLEIALGPAAKGRRR